MLGTCGIIRPYPGLLGARVLNLVEGIGYQVDPEAVLPIKTPDERAARWISRSSLDLVVVPFHLHRGEEGEVLDGIGVLLHLPDVNQLEGVTFLMPVKKFSWGASFQRRVDELRSARPNLLPQLIVVHEDDLDRPSVAARLRRAAEHGTSPRDASRPSYRPSMSSSLNLPSVPPSKVADSRPLSTRRNAPHSQSGSSGQHEPFRPRMSSLPPGSAPASGARPSGGAQGGARGSHSSRPPSQVRVRVESARENFRRAAEIGAEAQLLHRKNKKRR